MGHLKVPGKRGSSIHHIRKKPICLASAFSGIITIVLPWNLTQLESQYPSISCREQLECIFQRGSFFPSCRWSSLFLVGMEEARPMEKRWSPYCFATHHNNTEYRSRSTPIAKTSARDMYRSNTTNLSFFHNIPKISRTGLAKRVYAATDETCVPKSIGIRMRVECCVLLRVLRIYLLKERAPGHSMEHQRFTIDIHETFTFTSTPVLIGRRTLWGDVPMDCRTQSQGHLLAEWGDH